MNRPKNDEIIDKYLEHFNNSNQSKKVRRSSLNYFFNSNYFNFNEHVFDITTTTLIDYFNYLKALKNISITTKKFKWTILCSFLNYIMEYYYEDYKYFVKIPQKTVNWGNGHKRAKSNKNVIASKDEIVKILGYFKTNDYYGYLMLRLLCESGCRKGGILNLRYEDVNIEKRYFITREKTKDELAYYFSKNLAQHLEMFVEQRKKIESEHEELFLNDKTLKPYSLRALNLKLEKARNSLNIKKRITCHTFRRTINTLRKQMGCSNEDRKILLNHKTTSDVNLNSYTQLEYENFIQMYDTWNPYKDLQF